MKAAFLRKQSPSSLLHEHTNPSLRPRGFVAALALLLLAGSGLTTIAHAQSGVFDLGKPAGSPYWWTLTPELRPDELKTAFSSPEASWLRYLEAAAEGFEPPLPEDRLERLVVYVHPATTPELLPMWFAYTVFVESYLSRDGDEETAKALSSYGISYYGVERIIVLSHKHAQEEQALTDQLRPDQIRFVELQRKALLRDEPGTQGRLRAALQKKDLPELSALTGESPQEAQRLLAAWSTNPAGETGPASLVGLRADLGSADWEAFRSYLLEKIASGIGTIVDREAEE
jgi:hypothetical protein